MTATNEVPVCIICVQARLMSRLRGDQYQTSLVADSECEKKLSEVTTGMLKVFEYAQGK